MVRKLTRALLWLMAANALLWAVGRYIGARNQRGDDTSAAFNMLTLWGGDALTSHAPAFRAGNATVVGGGITIDLTDAGLDPGGAQLALDITGGGATVLVRDDWRVTVDEDTKLGGLEVDVTPADRLPPGSPHLHIRTRTRAGGGLITATTSH